MRYPLHHADTVSARRGHESQNNEENRLRLLETLAKLCAILAGVL